MNNIKESIVFMNLRIKYKHFLKFILYLQAIKYLKLKFHNV